MAAVGRVDNVVVLSGELFDAIEVNAARTGNHKRAAVRMSRLAVQAWANSCGAVGIPSLPDGFSPVGCPDTRPFPD